MKTIQLTKEELSVLVINPFTKLDKSPSNYCVVCINPSAGEPVYVESFREFRKCLKIEPRDYKFSFSQFHLVSLFK